MAFRYSQNEFAIICAGLSIQFAEITANNRLKLHQLIIGPDTPGVLVESNKELFSISYLGQHAYEKYSYHSAQPEVLDLPSNVFCLDDDRNSLILYPLHGQEKFLLYCLTSDGPTLYIVPLDTAEMTRGVAAHGYPHSSLDGSYISMVNGSHITSFVTANQSVLPGVDIFSSRVNRFEFLSYRDALVLTEGGEYCVMRLGRSTTSEKRQLLGGVPVKWVWVTPCSCYLYVTGNELYLLNETSDKPELLKSVASQPELLLFFMKFVPTTEPPVDVLPPNNISKLSEDSRSQETQTTIIVSSVLGGTIIATVVSIVVVVIVLKRRNENRKKHQRLSELPIQETNTQNLPLNNTLQDTGERNKEKQHETSFSQPADEPLNATNPHSSSTTNIATTSEDPQHQKKTVDVTERDIANFLPVKYAEQVMCPPEVPKVSIEPGKSAADKTPAPTPTTSGVFLPTLTGHTHGQNDFIAFQDYPSCPRNTSTAASAFGPGEEETTLIYCDMLTN